MIPSRVAGQGRPIDNDWPPPDVNPAADRVRAFLRARATLPGLDPEDITGAEGHLLTVSDLTALVDAVAEVEIP